MKLRSLTFRSFLTAGLIIGLVPVVSAADPVNERIEGFKESKRSIARIEDAIQKGDALTVSDQARLLAIFAEKIPSLYPEDAKGGFFSKAKGQIWESFPDFSQKANSFQVSSQQLEASARADNVDIGVLTQRLRAVQDSCVSCHRQYKKGR
ncbi:cytochrome c [Corticibacter populi]|uniref:Cytochrome c n=1 Tax=Corticibacter populi TaxID=1550736 RepID=A0A3M6QM40_9BURK|nr:cytochrome c [Corticibacter populi]RMX04148.1 cytochrome c [Corticibacter populi]RZS33161.1 cytochrome c556 [Corticibacter populi]